VRAKPLVVLAGLWAVAGLCAAVAACDNMANQPKRLPFELPYGAEANWPALPPPNTVARDDVPVPVPPLTVALLERGQQRFDIYCAPCHSRLGDGHGMIVQRGFPAPPSYYIDRLRQAPVQHFYDVITHGHGAMFSYADRVTPSDCWAIVAYIRALQASGTAALSDVPADQRTALQ
jgi:mono/diheme cytochrome c family protein